jgi:hypothetical protein
VGKLRFFATACSYIVELFTPIGAFADNALLLLV